MPTVRSLSDAVLSYSSTSSGKRRRDDGEQRLELARAFRRRGRCACRRARPRPSSGDGRSRRWPRAAHARAAGRSSACMMRERRRRCRRRRYRRGGWRGARARAASARSHTARGGTCAPSAFSTACAKAMRVRDRAVARDAAGERRRALERRAGHQRLDALVHIAEPLLQPHHGLAVGGEAEVARLDDAGVHRADRDLVQAFAFGRQERIRAAVPQPGPRVGRAFGLAARRDRCIARSRRIAGGCRRPTEGKAPARAGEVQHTGSPRRFDQRQVREARLAPQAEERCSLRAAGAPPPAPRRRGPRCEGVQSMSVQQRRDVLEPGDQRRRQPDAGHQHQREVQADRQERSLDRIVAPVGIAERQAVQAQEQRAERRPAARGRG